MYLRSTSRKNRDGSVVTYLSLARSYRDPETRQPRAENLYNFGRADRMNRDALVRLCRSIARVCGVEVRDLVGGKDGAPSTDLPHGMELVGTRELGPIWVLEALWKRLGIRRHLEKVMREGGVRVP